MRKIVIFALLMCICVVVPSMSYTEDASTVRLARTIYALASGESYETKLAVGSVIMNRVESPWYPGDLMSVLSQQHQFPCGQRYDSESLKAAHALISGARALPGEIIALQARDASAPRDPSEIRVCVGNYNFFATDLR